MKPWICPSCGATLNAPPEAQHVLCGNCSALVFRPVDGPDVLVAHPNAQMAQQIGAVLIHGGYHPTWVKSGSDVLSYVEKVRPDGVVLDVALQGSLFFEVIEQLRAHSDFGAKKIILVASVFNGAAYKRRPTSLYGADDYVEQHHIPDLLPKKLDGIKNPKISEDTPAMREQRSDIEEAEVRNDLLGEERIQVLARNIVADIALYHQSEFETLLVEGNYAILEDALQEGRKLLAEKAGPLPTNDVDPIAEALMHLIREMRQTQ